MYVLFLTNRFFFVDTGYNKQDQLNISRYIEHVVKILHIARTMHENTILSENSHFLRVLLLLLLK